jgi:hypothetical protein
MFSRAYFAWPILYLFSFLVIPNQQAAVVGNRFVTDYARIPFTRVKVESDDVGLQLVVLAVHTSRLSSVGCEFGRVRQSPFAAQNDFAPLAKFQKLDATDVPAPS